MPRETHPQTNFTGGEWSPKADARIDIDKYNNSAYLIENFWINQVGGAFFRPGTAYSNTVKTTSDGKVFLLNFQYNTQQNYVIEVGNMYFRYYANNGLVISAPSTPVETVTPYAIADAFSLRTAQSLDTQYIVSTLGTYQPYKHVRSSSTKFALNIVSLIGGPYQDTNITATTITASADTGSGITLTATIPAWATSTQYVQGAFVTNSGSTYRCILPNISDPSSFANDLALGYWVVDAFFKVGHVGSLFGVGGTGQPLGTVVITAFNSATQVTGYVQNTATGAAGNLNTSGAAVVNWAFGAFSNIIGWPTSCVFYEQRLYYGMGDTFFGSTIGAFDDFSAGTELDTDAVDYQLLSDLANNIGWMGGTNVGLKMGTSDGSFIVSSGTQDLPISASNISAQKNTIYGSANLYPARIGGAIYYATLDLMQIRELQYYIDITADRSVDMTLLADHILFDGGGAVQIDHQQYPNDRVWVVRADGQIPILIRNIEQEVQGWCRTVMAASSGIQGVVESLTIIPTSTGTNQIWVSVLRYINNVATRCIEYFTPENFINAWDPVRMDCSLTYNVPITITGITVGSGPNFQITVTAPAHGLSNTNQIKIDNVVGMTQLNGNFYKIANVTTDTFTLTDLTLAANITSGSGFNIYLSGGQVRKMITTVTGLDYLDGEQVCVSCDGGLPGKQQLYTVSGGSITLLQPAAVINVGLAYTGTIQLQKFSGTAQGKMTRIYLSTMRVVDSLGLQIGTDLNNLGKYEFQPVNSSLGHPPALVTQDLEIKWQATWSKQAQVYIVQNTPLPLFICGGIFRTESEDLN